MSVKRLIRFSAILKSPGHNTKRQVQHYLELPILLARLNDLCGGNKVILELYDVLFCFGCFFKIFFHLSYFKVKRYATCHLGNSLNATGYLPTRSRTPTAWEYSPVETQVQSITLEAGITKKQIQFIFIRAGLTEQISLDLADNAVIKMR